MNNFELIDFRFAEIGDKYDLKYNAWSRIYEYPYVIDFIMGHKYKNFSVAKIHNSSWGYKGIHVTFRDELDAIGECVHSDIVSSEFRETYYYDITTENRDFENKFDFVLNISTIEHLNTSQETLSAIQNLFKQVKLGGYLILTFDYPRVNLVEIEALIGSKCRRSINAVNGENSAVPDKVYKNLNVVYLILKKNE